MREKHPQQSLVSLAVLTHRSDGPTTQTYSYEHWGCSMEFSFPVVNLESWRPRITELQEMASDNPFSVVVLAQLEANARHPGDVQLVRKTELVRRLHHRGFDRDQIVQLFTIMDAMLVLPESMEEAFVHAVSQIQEEYQMTYVNTIERVALRRERQEGKQEAAAALLAMQVTEKFGELPGWAKTRLAQADESTVNRWARQILTAQHIEDVFA